MEHQMDKKTMPRQVMQVISIAESLFHNQILGIYLYGSATVGGLHPDSDIDILIIVSAARLSQISLKKSRPAVLRKSPGAEAQNLICA